MATDERVGEAFVEVRARLDRLAKDLQMGEKKTQASVSKMNTFFAKTGKAVRSVGGAVAKFSSILTAGLVASMAAASKETLNTLDSLDKMSTRLGVSTDFLQEAGFAASQSGVEMNTLSMAMQRYTRRSAEARAGTGEAKDAIKELGLQLVNTDGTVKNSEQSFREAIVALGEVEDPARRLRLAFKLFDSEGASLVQMADNFENLTDKARENGLVVDQSIIQKAVEAKDQLDLLTRTVKANLSQALVDFSPVLISIASALATVARMAGTAAVKLKDFMNGDPTTRDEMVDRIEEIGTELEQLTNKAVKSTQQFEQVFGRAFDPTKSDQATESQKRFLQTIRSQMDVLKDTRGELEERIRLLDEASKVPPPVVFDPSALKMSAEQKRKMAAADKEAAKLAEEAALRRLQLQDDINAKYWEGIEAMREQGEIMTEFWDDFSDDAGRSLANMVSDGEVSFKALGEAFVSEFTQRALNSLVFSPLFKLLGAGISAVGASFSSANTSYGPFSGGLVTPETDAFSGLGGGIGGGAMTPFPESFGATVGAVTVINQTPSQVTASSALDGSVEILVGDSAARSVSSGGPLGAALQNRYNLTPRPMRG